VLGLGTSTRPFRRFGVGWVAFDNDGDFDRFEANGRVALPDSVPEGQQDPFAEPNVLLVGDTAMKWATVLRFLNVQQLVSPEITQHLRLT
jgi:hypothetical protein